MRTVATIVLCLVLVGVASAQDVTFKVNMSVQMLRSVFDLHQDTIYISGSFNGWGTDNMLTDEDGDSVYETTLTPGSVDEVIQFKFRYYDGSAGGFVWESDPNREYMIPAGASTFQDYFNRDSVFNPQVDIEMTFSVNMELERLSGRFDPNSHVVSVNGDFNGWASGVSVLTSNPLDPDIYEGTFTISKAAGEQIQFKFWYSENNWESIDNRVYTFTEEDVANLAASLSGSFNNGTLENVLNQPCTIKFTVNTNGSVSSISGQPFPVVNTVHIAGSALPLQWPSGGWPNSEITRVIQLFDDGTNGDEVAGDMIFTRQITFPAYTVLDVKYKYGINWGDADNNGGGNDNEAGFAQDHTLQMTRFMSSATAIDTFGRPTVTRLDDVTGVRDLPGLVPLAFSLSQNYPNPFNPTTQIRFALPRASDVSLTVFNVLGQVVRSMDIGHQQAGSYEIEFNANDLPSGVYLYTLRADRFVESKRMLLLK